MTIFSQGGTQGITLGFTNGEELRLEPSKSADQSSPRKFYVYGHYDNNGIPFYIGKGTRKRAWSRGRHYLWHRYVDRHLGREFSVIILEDNLSSEVAEEREHLWVGQESDTLVNWVNFGRVTDFAALDRFHMLQGKNRELVAKARVLEKESIERSISLYTKALKAIYEYASIQPEKGLVGKLIDEEREEIGINGDLVILNRLTICLNKQKRYEEAASVSVEYFGLYRCDLNLKGAEKIQKRVQRARSK